MSSLKSSKLTKIKLTPLQKAAISFTNSKYKQHIHNIISEKFDEDVYVLEYVFCKGRKFRFDWAIPALSIAIEYEGIMKGKSRHVTITGFTNDCEKYNIATKLGWKVLRYTAINYTDIENDLDNLLKYSV